MVMEFLLVILIYTCIIAVAQSSALNSNSITSNFRLNTLLLSLTNSNLAFSSTYLDYLNNNITFFLMDSNPTLVYCTLPSDSSFKCSSKVFSNLKNDLVNVFGSGLWIANNEYAYTTTFLYAEGDVNQFVAIVNYLYFDGINMYPSVSSTKSSIIMTFIPDTNTVKLIQRLIIKSQNFLVGILLKYDSNAVQTAFLYSTNLSDQKSITAEVFSFNLYKNPVQVKLYPYKDSSYLIYLTYESNSLCLNFVKNSNLVITKKCTDTIVDVIEVFNYDLKDYYNDLSMIIIYRYAGTSIKVSKFKISGDPDSGVIISEFDSTLPMIGTHLNTANNIITEIRWMQKWLFFTYTSNNNFYIATILLMPQDFRESVLFSTSSADLGYESLLDIIVTELPSSGDIQFFLITSRLDALKGKYLIEINEMYKASSSSNPLFFDGASTGNHRFECPLNQFFAKINNNKYACTTCSAGFVMNNLCVESGCTVVDNIKAKMLGYCPTTNANIYYNPIAYSRRYNIKSKLCSSGLVNINNDCKICQSLNLFQMYNKCASKCPAGFWSDNSRFCQLPNCSSNQILNPIKNICADCDVRKSYMFDLVSETCVSQCADKSMINNFFYCGCLKSQTLSVNPPQSQCNSNTYCNFKSAISFTSGWSFCTNTDSLDIAINKQCSNGFNFNPDTGLCERCLSGTSSNGQACVKNCPIGKVQNQNRDGSYTCIVCPANQLVYLNECVKQCPYNTTAIVSQSICIKGCPVSNTSSSSTASKSKTTCTVDCLINQAYYNSASNTCAICPDAKPFLYSNFCVASCPIRSQLYGSACVPCGPTEFYNTMTGACITSCPADYKYDNTKGICQNCSIDGMYYNTLTGKCIATCPKNYVANSDLGCIYASILAFNNTLVAACPAGYQADSNSICQRCPQYYSNNRCVTECPQDTYPDSTNVCYSCLSINKILLDNKCVDYCDLEKYVYNVTLNSCQILQINKIVPGQCPCGNNGVCKVGYLEMQSSWGDCSPCVCYQNSYGKYCDLYDIEMINYQSKIKQLFSQLPSQNDLRKKSSQYYVNGGLTSSQIANLQVLVSMLVDYPDMYDINYENYLYLLANSNLDSLINSQSSLNSKDAFNITALYIQVAKLK